MVAGDKEVEEETASGGERLFLVGVHLLLGSRVSEAAMVTRESWALAAMS